MRVLRHRDFALLWWGQLVSQLGNQLNYIALAWLVLVTTGSTTAMGGVYLAQVLPNALLGWVVGVVTDRLDRCWLMIATDWLRGALVALLPLAYHLGMLQLWMVYGVTFLVSTLTLAFYSAEKSVIPALVDEDDLTEANAFAEMTAQVANLIGPVLAGTLVALFSNEIFVLYLDIATFFVSALALNLMAWRDRRKQRTAATVGELMQEAREGVEFLLRGRFLRIAFLTGTAANFLVMPFAVVFPVLAERTLGAGPEGFGWLMGGLGGGLLVGSLLAAPLSKRLSPLVLIYGGMALLGVSFTCLAWQTSLVVCVLLAFTAGLGVSPANAVVITMVQKVTPEELQGRVFSSMFAVVGLAAPLGVALASFLLEPWGPSWVLASIGVATIGVAAVGGALAAAVGVPEAPRT